MLVCVRVPVCICVTSVRSCYTWLDCVHSITRPDGPALLAVDNYCTVGMINLPCSKINYTIIGHSNISFVKALFWIIEDVTVAKLISYIMRVIFSKQIVFDILDDIKFHKQIMSSLSSLALKHNANVKVLINWSLNNPVNLCLIEFINTTNSSPLTLCFRA